MPMKVLVTGGAGYTGTPLCAALLAAGHHVTLVDNFVFGFESILHLVTHPRLRIVKTDIRNEDRSYLRDQDVVFHLAAISGYPACEANPHSAKLINVDATRAIAEALSPDQALIFASTTSFYGSSGQLSTEETAPAAVSLYGVTKQDGEGIVMARAHSVALRWATVFGVSPRMRAGLLVNDFVAHAVQDRTIVLYDADSRRTFIHVDDIVRGYMFCLDHLEQMYGRIFNMGTERLNYTKREIATLIASKVKCDIVESNLGDTDIRNFTVSFDRVAEIGFDCENTLEAGIDDLIKLYRFFTPNSFIKPM